MIEIKPHIAALGFGFFGALIIAAIHVVAGAHVMQKESLATYDIVAGPFSLLTLSKNSSMVTFHFDTQSIAYIGAFTVLLYLLFYLWSVIRLKQY